MKESTRKRKKAIAGMKEAYGKQEIVEQMYRILVTGKQGLDAMMKELGRMVAEAIMYIEREEVAGPEYRPYRADIWKWASQPGSIYLGDQKIRVEHPRLRGPEGEIVLKSYRKMKEPEGFSEELLPMARRGESIKWDIVSEVCGDSNRGSRGIRGIGQYGIEAYN